MSKSIFDSMSKEELLAMGVEFEEDLTELEETENVEVDAYDVLGVNSSDEENLEEEEDELYEEFEDDFEDYSEEEIIEKIENDEDLLNPEVPVRESYEEIMRKMEGETTEIPVDNRDLIYDSTGQPVKFQVDGRMYVKEIELKDIYLPPRTRKIRNNSTDDLESLILQWGLIEPLHVIPFNGKYLLVHGFRRYQALKNLNYEKALCLVDETRPKITLRFLEVICNNIKKLDFFEIMEFGEFIERKQNTFQSETIEKIVGMEAGDYLKAKYIRQFDRFGIIGEVASGKRTIKEGFKKLEKELDKLEKEKAEMLNVEFNEQGLPESYLEAIEEEANVQDVKDRKPLPAHVYARIKARDKYTCQTCGIGYNQPELNAIHEVHHIVPVKQGGSDDDNNLILICSNCHKVVGAYINGEFKPPKENAEMYKNMILLGNIARRGVPEGTTAYHFYMENCEQDWIE